MPLPEFAPTPYGVDEQAFVAAADAVRAYCGWHVAPVVEETLTLDGRGGGRLILPTLRVVDILTLTVDGMIVDEPEWSTAGVLWGRFPDRPRSVTVTLQHGYETAPTDLVALITAVTAAGSVAATPASAQVDDARITFAAPAAPYTVGGFTAGQRSLLDRYRLPVLA